jgi:hypothetical protein
MIWAFEIRLVATTAASAMRAMSEVGLRTKAMCCLLGAARSIQGEPEGLMAKSLPRRQNMFAEDVDHAPQHLSQMSAMVMRSKKALRYATSCETVAPLQRKMLCCNTLPPCA